MKDLSEVIENSVRTYSKIMGRIMTNLRLVLMNFKGELAAWLSGFPC